MFGAQSTLAFGTPSSTPAFGTLSTPSFATGFAASLFSTPFSQPSQPQQQQTPLFQPQQSSSGFGFSTSFGAVQAQSSPFGQSTLTPGLPFGKAQLTTQMAHVDPLPFSLADRDIQRLLMLTRWSLETLSMRLRHPTGALEFESLGDHCVVVATMVVQCDSPNIELSQLVYPSSHLQIMWLEAMGIWEEWKTGNALVQGFKDLPQCLKLQRHFQADNHSVDQRAERQKEQGLQRCLLRVMKILVALEGKCCQLPLMKGEAELAEKLAAINRQLIGSGAEEGSKSANCIPWPSKYMNKVLLIYRSYGWTSFKFIMLIIWSFFLRC